jgi:hypothetical protein
MNISLKQIHSIVFLKVDGTISQFCSLDASAAQAKWDDWLARVDETDKDADSDNTELLHTCGIWYHAGRVIKQVSSINNNP